MSTIVAESLERSGNGIQADFPSADYRSNWAMAGWRGIREIARSTGLARKTIRKYILAAQSCGLAETGRHQQNHN